MTKSMIRIEILNKDSSHHVCPNLHADFREPTTVDIPFEGSLRRTYAPLTSWLNKLVDDARAYPVEDGEEHGSHHVSVRLGMVDVYSREATYIVAVTLACTQYVYLVNRLLTFCHTVRRVHRTTELNRYWELIPYWPVGYELEVDNDLEGT